MKLKKTNFRTGTIDKSEPNREEIARQLYSKVTMNNSSHKQPDKLRIVIDSLFEHRGGFTPEQLTETLDKNGIVVLDKSRLITNLIEQQIIEKTDDGLYSVKGPNE